MPELRKDVTTNTWVIIASERGKRPHDFTFRADERVPRACPFCPGHESETPPEVLALGRPQGADAPDTPGWEVRVIPNKFPALAHVALPDQEGGTAAELGAAAQTDLVRKGSEAGGAGPAAPAVDVGADRLYLHMPAVGAHEVIIESPQHDATVGSYTIHHLRLILQAVLARYQALSRVPGLRYFQAFKNFGRIAGASLEHAHSQLMVTPMIPPATEAMIIAGQQYFRAAGNCPLCDLVAEESRLKRRMVWQSQYFLMFCPYASRFPFETWIVPCLHQPYFGSLADHAEALTSLAEAVQYLLQRVEAEFGPVPYNITLHTAPWEPGHEAYLHWHLRFTPRLTIIAGFELGTGVYVNPTAPELAAEVLRNS